MNKRIEIENAVIDLVANFLYYDRKEDENLERGEIEAAIETREITLDEIVELFKQELIKGINE